jgi:hypothetical protein
MSGQPCPNETTLPLPVPEVAQQNLISGFERGLCRACRDALSEVKEPRLLDEWENKGYIEGMCFCGFTERVTSTDVPDAQLARQTLNQKMFDHETEKHKSPAC